MKTVPGIVFSLSVLLVVALLCANAIAAEPAVFLQAIKLNALDGAELERKTVSGPYSTEDDCSIAQQATGTQRPVLHAGGPPTITVFMCAALPPNGDRAL